MRPWANSSVIYASWRGSESVGAVDGAFAWTRAPDRRDTLHSRRATKATIFVMTADDARSSAAATAAASVEATGSRMVKISTSATRPLFSATIRAATSTCDLATSARRARRRGCRGRARSRPSPRRRRATARVRRSGMSRRGGRGTATTAAAASVRPAAARASSPSRTRMRSLSRSSVATGWPIGSEPGTGAPPAASPR